MGLRIATSLPEQLEVLVSRTIGCALEVHKTLGPGFFESVYRDAMCVELAAQELAFIRECPIDVMYRGIPIHGHRLDLLVEHQVIVELKAVEKLMPIHEVQAVSYLKATGLRIALLMNFSESLLHKGLRRIVR